MESTSMNIRMDAKVKREAECLFQDLGLNMTTAINIFLRQAVRQQRIPFEIKMAMPNAATVMALMEAEATLKDPNAKTYNSVEELFAELNAEIAAEIEAEMVEA